MKKLLDEIRNAKFSFEVSLKGMAELEETLAKGEPIMCEQTDCGCACPKCHTPLARDGFYCMNCGQRVVYRESKDIPL